MHKYFYLFKINTQIIFLKTNLEKSPYQKNSFAQQALTKNY